jgi:hypothetical protein
MKSFQSYFNLAKKKSTVSLMIRWASQNVLNAKRRSCERNVHLLSKSKGVGAQGVGKDNMVGCTNQEKDPDNSWSIDDT